MFARRKFSNVIFRCLYTPVPIRSQSSTTNDLIKTSSKEIGEKAQIETNLWTTSETNRLIDYLSTRIQTIGPITVADFMREALRHPKYVYYSCFFLFFLISLRL